MSSTYFQFLWHKVNHSSCVSCTCYSKVNHSLESYLEETRLNIEIREFANNVFDARIYLSLCYTSLISVCDVIS